MPGEIDVQKVAGDYLAEAHNNPKDKKRPEPVGPFTDVVNAYVLFPAALGVDYSRESELRQITGMRIYRTTDLFVVSAYDIEDFVWSVSGYVLGPTALEQLAGQRLAGERLLQAAREQERQAAEARTERPVAREEAPQEAEELPDRAWRVRLTPAQYRRRVLYEGKVIPLYTYLKKLKKQNRIEVQKRRNWDGDYVGPWYNWGGLRDYKIIGDRETLRYIHELLHGAGQQQPAQPVQHAPPVPQPQQQPAQAPPAQQPQAAPRQQPAAQPPQAAPRPPQAARIAPQTAQPPQAQPRAPPAQLPQVAFRNDFLKPGKKKGKGKEKQKKVEEKICAYNITPFKYNTNGFSTYLQGLERGKRIEIKTIRNRGENYKGPWYAWNGVLNYRITGDEKTIELIKKKFNLPVKKKSEEPKKKKKDNKTPPKIYEGEVIVKGTQVPLQPAAMPKVPQAFDGQNLDEILGGLNGFQPLALAQLPKLPNGKKDNGGKLTIEEFYELFYNHVAIPTGNNGEEWRGVYAITGLSIDTGYEILNGLKHPLLTSEQDHLHIPENGFGLQE